MNSDSKAHFNSDEFVDRLKNRDAEAITQFIQFYTTHIINAAFGLGFNSDDAQELSQTTMVTFYDVVPLFQKRSHIRTFLFGIFYNKVKEIRRDQSKMKRHDPIDDQFLENGMWNPAKAPLSPELFLTSCETREIIEKCLDELPLPQRMAFILKIIEEEETEEVCNILEVSATNLRQLLFRGRHQLRLCIESKRKTERIK